jgi:hypothetical protein
VICLTASAAERGTFFGSSVFFVPSDTERLGILRRESGEKQEGLHGAHHSG